MNKNNDFSNITLEQVAGMVASGFEQMATKDDLEALAQTVAKGFGETATKDEVQKLRKETQAGFAYINITLDKHMGAVREQTDELARRVKKLEQAVFGVGKNPER